MGPTLQFKNPDAHPRFHPNCLLLRAQLASLETHEYASILSLVRLRPSPEIMEEIATHSWPLHHYQANFQPLNSHQDRFYLDSLLWLYNRGRGLQINPHGVAH